MALRVAVVVPGIMGSTLFRDTATGRHDIWSADITKNYNLLLRQPTLIRWVGVEAQSDLIEQFYPVDLNLLGHGIVPPIPRVWGKTLQLLAEHQRFGEINRTLKFSYDWRQSLVDSARRLGEYISSDITRLSGDQGSPVKDVKYEFLTHSMGGLVVRIALAIAALSPANVGKIVHIGSPLLGSPNAFRSAYKSGSLPLLASLSKFFYRPNGPKFFKHLLSALQTFPSVYQLMPPIGREYLVHEMGNNFNPLSEEFLPRSMRDFATEAHQRLVEGQDLIKSHDIETYTIYGESGVATDLSYHVRYAGDSGYEILTEMRADTGDGTVLAESSRGNGLRHNPLLNVSHTTLCNDERVIRVLRGIL